jgi:hypothetical protein
MRLSQQVVRFDTAKVVFRPILKRTYLLVLVSLWVIASLVGVALAWSNDDASTSKAQTAHTSQKPANLEQTMTEDGTTHNLSLQINHSGSATTVTNSTTINSTDSSNAQSSSQLTVNGQNVPIPSNGSVQKTLHDGNGSVDVSVDNSSSSANNSSLNISVQSSSTSDNSAP